MTTETTKCKWQISPHADAVVECPQHGHVAICESDEEARIIVKMRSALIEIKEELEYDISNGNVALDLATKGLIL